MFCCVESEHNAPFCNVAHCIATYVIESSWFVLCCVMLYGCALFCVVLCCIVTNVCCVVLGCRVLY